MFSLGWTPPLGRDGKMLTHVTNGNIMICARKEEKVLPAAVVRDFVNDRIAEIENANSRKLSRKEQQSLRDEVIYDLLPKAFTRSTLTYAYIAPVDGWFIVDASSSRKSEELTSLLRQSLGTLSLTFPAVRKSPTVIMTDWLRYGVVPGDFEVENECELREPGEDGSIIRCKRQDLGSDEIRAHLDAGKQASKLALRWEDRLSFILDEDLSIKRLKFEELIQQEAEDVETDDAATRFDADFALMSLELSRFLQRLLEVLGGEEQVHEDKVA